MKDIKDIRDGFPKPADKERAPINALPEYTIRTMKDDLARISLKGLEEEAKETEEVGVLRKKLKEKQISPPERLPVAPSKAPLPSTEELITEKEIPKPPQPKAERPMPSPPLVEAVVAKKREPKILIILIILILILAGIGGFFYWQGTKQPLPPEPEPQPQSLQPSESLISVNSTKILSLDPQAILFELLEQEAQLDQAIGTFKRIAILKNEEEFFSLTEFIQKLEISIPPYALAELKENYTLVLYSQNGKTHLGLITEIENSDTLKEQLRFWEQAMANDLENFFLGESRGEPSTLNFQDNIYKETDIRYVNFPEPDLTIDYAIVNNLLVLITSRESMYRIIDKIKL